MNQEEDQTVVEEAFNIILDSSLDLIFLINENGSIVQANIEACRYLGQTIRYIRRANIKTFIEDKTKFEEIIKDIETEKQAKGRFWVKGKDKKGQPFDVIATLIQSSKHNMIVVICRSIQDRLESEAQRTFFYDLFQFELLNKLHAKIGYIDLAKSNLETGNLASVHLLNRIRKITIDVIYLIQNVNILLILDDNELLTNHRIDDMINHAQRYLNYFFSDRIKVKVHRTNRHLVAGDEYLYRIFVNIIVKMAEKAKGDLEAEITVKEPYYDEMNVVLHFEDVFLSFNEKRDFSVTEDLTTKNIGMLVIRELIDRYRLKIKLEDVKRMGDVVGTRVILTFPVIKNKHKSDL